MTGYRALDYSSLNPHPFHVYPILNSSFYDIQRGHFPSISDGVTLTTFSIYEPPSEELYTIFSLQTYLLAFCGILLLQVLTILITDKIFVKNIPKSATFWERFIHACEKSHFPFPFTNWHEEKGNCHDHMSKKKEVEQEVLITSFVNLLFNMTMLFPLVILCKFMLSNDLMNDFLSRDFINLKVFLQTLIF